MRTFFVARAEGISRGLQTIKVTQAPFIGTDGPVGLVDLFNEANVRLTVSNPIETPLRLLSIGLSCSRFAVAAPVYAIGPVLRWPARRGFAFVDLTPLWNFS